MTNPALLNYQITPKNLHGHIFQVTLTLASPNPLGQVFSLPSWIVGSYCIRDFSKQIVGIRARSGGVQIPIKKLDKNHWLCQPCTHEITLEYEIYAFDLSPRTAYLSDERGFFNGSSVFLLPLGFEHLPCQVVVNYPNPAQAPLGQWACATGLKLQTTQRDTMRNAQIYRAQNYQELIDSPVEMADFTRFEFSVKNTQHLMTLTGQHSADIVRLSADLHTICSHHIEFFGGQIPFQQYVFLTLVRTHGYGGLEHKNSTSLICAKDELPDVNTPEMTPKYTRFLALCAHEYFHAWWIKIIKPASFHQLDLTQENYTEQLWIFEGFTSYYDELSLLRTKILSPQQYLSLFAQTVTKVQRQQGRFQQTLAQASYDTWTKFYQQDENSPNSTTSYYTKGALLAFVLDVEIRKRSHSEHSLDNVLQHCWQYYQHSGLENNTVQAVVEYITQSDFSQFFNDYLYDTLELPLIAAFEFVGVHCKFIHQQGDLADFGIQIIAKNELAVITCVLADTCAQRAGLYVGDTIISVNNQRVECQKLSAMIEAYAAGSVLKIIVSRDEMLLEIEWIVRQIEPTFCVLSVQKDADLITQNRQKQWFYQT